MIDDMLDDTRHEINVKFIVIIERNIIFPDFK